jgi:predicted kinase
MRKVIVLSGVSGSGKTTYAKKLWTAEPNSMCVSTDDYFMKYGIPYEGYPPVYCFDPTKLSDAHGKCFRDFIEVVRERVHSLVIVDNTNTTVEEIAPYMLAASAYGWEAEVHTIVVDVGRYGTARVVDTLARRNTHGVSRNAIISQGFRISLRELPKYWKCVKVDAQF